MCNLTCFQEASAVKIGACLRSNKAFSYHVTGRRCGHVQFKVLNDCLRTTLEKKGEEGAKNQLDTAL